MTEMPEPIDYVKTTKRAAEIAAIHLDHFNPGDFLDALDMLGNDLSRFVWLAIDDSRDDFDDPDNYFTSLTSEEYSRRYNAVAETLTVIFTAILARLPRR